MSRSLERVVRPPAYRGLLERRNWRRLNEGGSGASDWPQGQACQRDDPSGNQRVLERSRNSLNHGNGGNGNRLALE